MEKIKNIITAFEWAYENKPRLFSFGVIIGALVMYSVNINIQEKNEHNIAELREEIKVLKEENKKAQQDCLDKIKEVKEFLKYIAE